MSKKKLILVDDHKVIRNGLKVLLEKLGDFEVIKEYDNGRKLIEHLPYSVAPDLILMDVTMPEMDGEETVQALNDHGSKAPVLILTLTNDENRVVRLFRLGVRGYLLKDSSAATLKAAIDEIFRCGYYHNEFLTYSLRNEISGKHKTEQEMILDNLSDRERHFLKLVCHEAEYTYDQIAYEMGVQHRTVDGYRESIFEKFAIKSKTGLVLFVLKHNLFDHL